MYLRKYYKIAKKYSLFLAIIILIAISTACTRYFTTYSSINVSTFEIERVQQIVHRAFMDLGYSGGRRKLLKWKIGKKEIYDNFWYYGKGRIVPGDLTSYITFYVKYKFHKNKQMEIYIKNIRSGLTQEERNIIKKALDEVVELIDSKLQEAKLSVEIKKGFYWTPALNNPP